MLAAARLVMFSAEHVATLAVIALIAAALSLTVRWTADRPSALAIRRWVCFGIAVTTVGGAILKQVYEIVTGEWSLQASLPLHVCDMAVFITAAALVLAVADSTISVGRGGPTLQTAHTPEAVADRFAPSRRRLTQGLYEVAYYWGLGGTIQALLTPDVDEPFPHPVFFRYFLMHGGIVVGVMVMTFGLHMRPRARSWRRLWVLTLALAVVVLGIDGLLQANYMFLCGPPEHPSIIDCLGRWPWSLLSLAGLGTGLLLFWYSPWWLLDCVRRRAK